MFIHIKFSAKYLCGYFFCQIILGRAKSPCQNYDISALYCLADCFFHTLFIVTDNGLVEYIYAQLGQTLRDELCIGVYDVAQQDLCADCDKFCVQWIFLLWKNVIEVILQGGVSPPCGIANTCVYGR